MERLKIAAQFVAFVWHLNSKADKRVTPAQAGRFAREKWCNFLPLADDDMAKWLTAKPTQQDGRSYSRTNGRNRPYKMAIG
jgi:hypothetical protein